MEKEQSKTTKSYIFPKKFAEMMAKVDQQTQYEGSMLAMVMMMIGLVLSIVYVLIYLDFKLWFKIVTIINGSFGIVFMYSFLVTTFQQYQSYMQFKKLNNSMQSLQSQKEVLLDEPKQTVI